jgi:hypothetical protein
MIETIVALLLNLSCVLGQRVRIPGDPGGQVAPVRERHGEGPKADKCQVASSKRHGNKRTAVPKFSAKRAWKSSRV